MESLLAALKRATGVTFYHFQVGPLVGAVNDWMRQQSLASLEQKADPLLERIRALCKSLTPEGVPAIVHQNLFPKAQPDDSLEVMMATLDEAARADLQAKLELLQKAMPSNASVVGSLPPYSREWKWDAETQLWYAKLQIAQEGGHQADMEKLVVEGLIKGMPQLLLVLSQVRDFNNWTPEQWVPLIHRAVAQTVDTVSTQKLVTSLMAAAIAPQFSNPAHRAALIQKCATPQESKAPAPLSEVQPLPGVKPSEPKPLPGVKKALPKPQAALPLPPKPVPDAKHASPPGGMPVGDIAPKSPLKVEGMLFEIRTPFTFKTPDVEQRRASIEAQSGLDSFPTVDVKSFETLYELTDTYFFGGMVNKLLAATQRQIAFETSKAMTSSSGKMCFPVKGSSTYILRFSVPVFTKITPEALQQQKLFSDGIAVTSRRHAMQLTLEHELIHLLIHAATGGTDETSHGPLFKQMNANICGHLTCTHNLIIPDVKAPVPTGQLTKEMLRVGETVRLMEKGKEYSVVIVKLNPKRARVKLEDGRIGSIHYAALFR